MRLFVSQNAGRNSIGIDYSSPGYRWEKESVRFVSNKRFSAERYWRFCSGYRLIPRALDDSRWILTAPYGSRRPPTAPDETKRGSLDTLQLGMAAASHTICWLTLHLLLAAGVTSFLISVVRFVSSILHQFILLLCSDLYLNRHSLNTFSTRAPFFSLTPSLFPTFSLAHLYMWLAFSCVHIDLRYAPLARSQASPEIRR